MSSRSEGRALTRLVRASFEQVSKNPQSMKKWITSEGWLKIINDSNLGGEVTKKIGLTRFTKIMSSEFNVRDNNELNIYGVYVRKRRVSHGHDKGFKSKNNKYATCFLVTEKGNLPPTAESHNFYPSLIILIVPMPCGPQCHHPQCHLPQHHHPQP